MLISFEFYKKPCGNPKTLKEYPYFLKDVAESTHRLKKKPTENCGPSCSGRICTYCV
jgi:hypothetical protein